MITVVSTTPRSVLGAVVAATVLRIGLRLFEGRDAFFENSYRFYLTLAENLVSGAGLCYAPAEACALRMPLYPIFLSPFVISGTVYPGVVVVQGVLGGLLVWLAWWTGRELFNQGVGVMAAAATAVNPYAVVHDTALQDTVLVNVLMAASIALLLRSARGGRQLHWWFAGLAIALAIMTTARIALFAPMAIAWGVAVSATRVKTAVALSVPVLVLAGGWMVRNDRLVGAPVLTLEGGEALYFGNSPLTFTHFPRESIDLTAGEIETLPVTSRTALEALTADDAERDRLYRRWAVDYIRAEPLAVAWGAVRKLWVVVSAELSPERGPLVQWGYRLTFLTLHLLAIAGAVGAGGRDHRLVALIVAAFAVTTAVFWAHTSHKSYLDPLIFIYAAAGARYLRS
jgi:hypothetical protein